MSDFEKTIRRCRRYSGRLMRAATGTGLRQNMVFMHMPKCGGTSLSEALYAAVPISQRIGVLDARSTRRAAAILHFDQDDPWLCHDDLAHGHHTFSLRHALMLQHMAWETRLIHGHVLYPTQMQPHFSNQYALITVLRTPQERMISNYRMACHAGLVDHPFPEYLHSPLARQHARVYLRYFSGLSEVPDCDIPKALRIALDHTKSFSWIGFLDRMKDLKSGFQDRFAVRLNLPQYNTAQAKRPDIAPADQKHMDALLAPDQEIFDHLRGELVP